MQTSLAVEKSDAVLHSSLKLDNVYGAVIMTLE